MSGEGLREGEVQLDPNSSDEVIQLRAELEELQVQVTMKEARLDEIQTRWDNQKAQVEKQAADHRTQAEECEGRLKAIIHALETRGTGPPFVPPGPSQLLFVETHAFHLGATAIILANIVTMMLELIDKSYTPKFFWIDQFFMVFYVVEISLKGALLQRHLLVGKFSNVCWNWMDLIIVVTGVIDMYLKPLLVLCGAFPENSAKGPSVLSFLRLLRLARLARILKIVKEFLNADMSWADGDAFQSFIMAVIGANSLIMGFEADMPDFAGWFYVEQLLLLIFSFELLVRLKLQGCRFFINLDGIVWNWLDFVIVTGGIVDQWMMPCISFVQTLLGQPPAKSGNVGQIMMLLRMARLLRILRLVRLVRNIPPLYTLVLGIIEAMHGMAWVLLLTVVVLYTFALLAVRLVGHGLVFGGEAPQEAAVFPSVPETMFVLFKLMNADLGPMTGLFDVMPIMKLITVTFMIISTWSILSILTAVVSENMLSVSENTKEDGEEEADALAKKRSRVKLAEIFGNLDSDGSRTLSAQEFEAALKDEDTRYELCDAADLPERSLKSVWAALCMEDEDGNTYANYDDFIDGLEQEKTPVSERSMMRLEKRLASLENVLVAIQNAEFAEAERKAAEPVLEPQDGRSAPIAYQDNGRSFTAPKLWRPMHVNSIQRIDEQDGVSSVPLND